ncbi:MAG: hypothetical protein R2862_07705 [Thermoanaerobaculia bacterium]
MRGVRVALLLLVVAAPVRAASGYGELQFANSGAAAAQEDFLSGLALLHDFEYTAAAEAFRRAEAIDPGFALAFWGEAMTHNHPIWMQQDLAAARSALQRLAPTAPERRARAASEREKAWLDTIEILYGEGSKEERDFRYARAMADLHRLYPDDTDAAAFYGLSLLGTAHAGRDLATYMRAAGILEEAWMSARRHPGLLHYLIHSYDDPTHAPLGLRAARTYAEVAPDAGHAQHMTSHIFLALGMWQETVDANVAAIAAVDRMRAAAGKEPRRCGHYSSWLGYAYLQIGEAGKSRQTLDACRENAMGELATSDAGHSMDPDDSLGSSLASMRLHYLLDRGDWSGEVADWPLPPVAGPRARFDFAFARAVGAIATGRQQEIPLALADLETVAHEVVELEKAGGDPNPSQRLRPEILLLEAQALDAERRGEPARAEELLRRAAGLEDSLPVDFGPPTVDKPTHELLGEFLLRKGRRDEAAAEFRLALARAPGRRLALAGLAAAAR